MHPVSRLPELVINEVDVEAKSTYFCTKATSFFCTFVLSCDTYSKSVLLLPSSSSDSPNLMDKDNEFMQLRDTDALDGRIGDSVRYLRDGVMKSGHITNMLLDLVGHRCYITSSVASMRQFRLPVSSLSLLEIRKYLLFLRLLMITFVTAKILTQKTFSS